MIQGMSEPQICSREGGSVTAAARAGMEAAESSLVLRAGESHSSLGCHTRKNAMRQPMQMSDAPTSTIQGLTKFEMTNCGMAKETPQTRMAGQTSFMPRQPAKAQISQKGTMTEKKGSCRPTMAPSR